LEDGHEYVGGEVGKKVRNLEGEWVNKALKLRGIQGRVENMKNERKQPTWAIRPLVPEEVYTDRREHLDYLYAASLKAIRRRTMSTVLLGQRRMGKTEIFKRVVNRLFFEQEDPGDLDHSVVPVYFSFPDTVVDKWDFCMRYAENFVRWYAAFRLQDLDLLNAKTVQREDLRNVIESRLQVTKGFSFGLNLIDFLNDRGVTIPERETLMLPREVSDWDDTTIVMFLDEFQNTRLPQYDFDIVGWMQEAVESPTCPHFVTGSAMSILAREILGRGALFGRFRSKPISAMTEYWGAELTLKSASYYQADVSGELAPVVAERCGGNPFYINAVVQQAAEQGMVIDSEKALNETLAVDLSSGFIWGELSDQVNRWIERINQSGITKSVLYLSAIQEGDRLDLARIQEEVRKREGRDVPVEEIRDVLIKLSRGDLLEYMELGGWFRKIGDPILLEFLKVWGRIEVEGEDASRVQNELRTRYQRMKRRIHDQMGYLGEVYMAQILWNAQNKTLSARFFNSSEDVSVPWLFSYIHHRVRLGAGSDREIDVYAAAGAEVWICESKWWRDRKAGVQEIEIFLEKAQLVREFEGEGLQKLKLWFFSNSGFTDQALELMREKGILYSNRENLNGLLEYAGLRKLPEL
jgi:hypothetical protein